MANSRKNLKVDAFLSKAKTWRKEMEGLRTLLLGCDLTEQLKWGKPCYTFQESNIVVVVPLKDHCALLFSKGALLKDAQGVLIKPGENSQSARWMKFSSIGEIAEREATVKEYIHEAIEAEKAGVKVTYKKISEFKIPSELQKKWRETPALKTAFKALTPGRQRAYLLYFSAPKQSKTRVARIEKRAEQILNGKGLDD